jgi:hypothetical protein
MMQDQDEIIVLKQFDDAIDASIAKTKLDANGIPCFLTEENMANLYPGQNAFAFSVRLHVFKKDVEEASQLLFEGNFHVEVFDTTCPRCQSRKVQRDFPKEFSVKLLGALGVLFFGVFFPHKKVNHCLDCDYEF